MNEELIKLITELRVKKKKAILGEVPRVLKSNMKEDDLPHGKGLIAFWTHPPS